MKPDAVEQLYQFILQHPRLIIITGAGCSVASGIPAYRDYDGHWQRSAAIQHQEFISQLQSRKRYWARSLFNWPTIYAARPTAAHYALASLEKLGYCQLLVTQNVDRLHQHAGHQNVIDLHGRLDKIVCLSCNRNADRHLIQQQLLSMNAGLSHKWQHSETDPSNELEDSLTQLIDIPECHFCGGILKPDVVFYGGAVKKHTSQLISESINSADAILVVGSSLTVFSSFRFCRQAYKQSIPVAAINQGKTRADEFLSLKINSDCQQTLYSLSQYLGSRPRPNI
ncbi:MAG: NAD-dependent protein deacetylase [Pseudomonadales bacterium]|nr:NAD-dependent protein deacetylase [Pseudomonadales bacterium]